MVLVAAVTHPVSGSSLYVDYSYDPNPLELLQNDICIIHPNSIASLKEGQKRGNQFYAYISLAEVSKDEPYLPKLEALAIPFAGENPAWNSKLIDIRDEKWKAYFVQKLGSEIVVRDFDGFFIDTVDSIQLLKKNGDKSFAEYQRAAIDIITTLKETFPTKKILTNRGFDLMEELVEVVDGIVVESVFSSSDIEGSQTVAVDWQTTEALVGQIEKAQRIGFDTYIIDYVAAGDRKAARETETRIRSIGCVPYIGTRKLDGTNIYEKEVQRKLLVVYGYDPDENEEYPIFPEDTLALSKLQAPLEWMGYEFEYHNISNGIPEIADEEFCGVIIDESLAVPSALEVKFAQWLANRPARDQKVLFLGLGEMSSAIAKDIAFAPFGITFTGKVDRAARAAGEVSIKTIDENYMSYEVPTEATAKGFEALQAPDGAHILIGLEMTTVRGDFFRYDPVFFTDWGGCMLPPYARHQVSPEIDLSHVDPFKFLGQIWPTGEFPVPDVTTQQGLRIFYSHIDGDGFVSMANFPGQPLCGEVLYNEVLKDLPFPITVSIVEAEIRGHMLSQVKPDVALHETISKNIFQLPHVEVASHSYSHPYVWNAEDKSYYKEYSSLNLPLKLTTRYPKIDLNREIDGSLQYIKDKLSGTAKPPKIFLWSGNCRPSTEALRLVREAGIENMNGGNTILSRRFPGISAVAPKLISAEGEMQIFASNQNEFYYTDGWKGPWFNGFKKVIETFEMTESPRRMKPVNVYYHFYSAERPDSLSALQEIYDWCRVHELHLMNTSTYAAMVRDSFNTKISDLGSNSWKIQNPGRQQTFRIPVSKGWPDIPNSRGVIGYRKIQDSWYIATDSSAEVVITLSGKKIEHPHLVSSTETLRCENYTSETITLRNDSEVRTSKVRLGGLNDGKWQAELESGVTTGEQFKLLPGQSVTISKR